MRWCSCGSPTVGTNAEWAQLLGIGVVGNVIGGLGLVTVLRLMQVPHKVIRARRDEATFTPVSRCEEAQQA